MRARHGNFLVGKTKERSIGCLRVERCEEFSGIFENIVRFHDENWLNEIGNERVDVWVMINVRFVIIDEFFLNERKRKKKCLYVIEKRLTRRSRNFERNSKSSSHLSSFFGMTGLGKYSSWKKKIEFIIESRFFVFYRILVQVVKFSFSFLSVNQLDIEKSNVY